jgi:hypothetical protein
MKVMKTLRSNFGGHSTLVGENVLKQRFTVCVHCWDSIRKGLSAIQKGAGRAPKHTCDSD